MFNHNNMNLKKLSVNTNNSETYIGITNRAITSVIGVFTSASISTGIPTSSLHNIFIVGICC